MDTLQNMRVFLRVVEDGSFTAAANHLDSTTAQVSRAISDLEAHLRTRLLNRTTRRLALTEAGERYLQRSEHILAHVAEAEAEAGNALARPAGRLKIHAVTGFGQHYVIPSISRYRQRYPDVRIELTLAQRMPDLLDEGYDVSIITARDLPDSGLIAVRLAEMQTALFASPEYLSRHGTPKTLAELADHECLQMVSPNVPLDKWLFEGPRGQVTIPITRSGFRVNVPEAMVIAIREGMGIGLLPAYTAVTGLRERALVRVLPDHAMHPVSIYALYPSRQYLDAKIKTWVEFLRGDVQAMIAAEEAQAVEGSSKDPRAALS